jgi:hypothetical protein
MNTEPIASLPPPQHRELMLAISQLERQSFVARLARATGTPVDAAIKYLPNSITRRLREIIKMAILKSLEVAVDSLEDEADPSPSSEWMGKVLTGISGAVGGFFGMAALPFELPLTTTLMLRSIAEIARIEGEDVKNLDTKLACLEVFALGGGRGEKNKIGLEYYAARAVLTRLKQDICRSTMERGAINASSPIVARLIGEIVSRFGFAVSDRFASGIVPVIGALGGAAVNVVFIDHFQRVARGHFVVRRLEREYGAGVIRRHYTAAAMTMNGGLNLRPEAAD